VKKKEPLDAKEPQPGEGQPDKGPSPLTETCFVYLKGQPCRETVERKKLNNRRLGSHQAGRSLFRDWARLGVHKAGSAEGEKTNRIFVGDTAKGKRPLTTVEGQWEYNVLPDYQKKKKRALSRGWRGKARRNLNDEKTEQRICSLGRRDFSNWGIQWGD